MLVCYDDTLNVNNKYQESIVLKKKKNKGRKEREKREREKREREEEEREKLFIFYDTQIASFTHTNTIRFCPVITRGSCLTHMTRLYFKSYSI